MRVYVSARFSDADLARSFAARCARALGDALSELPFAWWEGDEHLAQTDLGYRRKLVREDLLAVRQAHVLVWLMPGGLGSHCELGAALANGTTVIAVGPTPAYWVDPPHPFLDHPRMVIVGNQDEALVALRAIVAVKA